MAKRYVYWRTPEGRPHKGNDSKHAPTALLAAIGESASVTSDGGVGWKDLSFLRHRTPIRSAIIILDGDGRELNEVDTWIISHSAIDAVIKQSGTGRPVDPSKLLLEADKLAANHFRKQLAKYVLVTSLSIESFPATRVRMHGCEISPLRTRGVRFPLPECLGRSRCEDAIARHLKSTQYHLVNVKTEGRSIHEAIDNALEALNLLRGLWTLFATYGSWSLCLDGRRQKPVGVIHTGPVHTLHHANGTLAADFHWYDPDYKEDQPLFKPEKGWSKIEANRRWTTTRLRHLAYRDDLKALIVRYATALDHSTMDVSFLQMWSILERITNTVGAKYDDTIRRAIRIYSDRNVAKEILESVRLRRNQYVHAAKSREGCDQAVYAVKQFVDSHLFMLIRNEFGVRSLEEYGEYLDLPTDTQVLKKQLRHLTQAVRAHKKAH